jgi:vacuolar-type H+-ATPase subunit I/STV1
MPWLGGFTVLAGVVMVRVAASRRSGVARVLAHLLVAASLSALAVGFLGSGIWTGAVGYATLALSVVFAPLLAEKAKSQEARPGSDLFAVAIGAGAAINGVLLLFAPHLFSTRFYDVVRPHLGWYGAAFLAGGVAVVASYAQSSQSGIAVKLSGWAVAAAFLAFGLPLPASGALPR